MIIDLIIVSIYFISVMVIALSGKQKMEMTSEEYFLSDRNLKWHSIAISTIATNIQGYQFLGMMGSAYLYGLAQAQFEINAVQGLFFAAFIFVPLYLKERVITITQFIKKRLGETVALIYTSANMLLFATMGLGAALFWGAYAADLVFSDYLAFISDIRWVRVGTLIAALGIFSAIYTYFGGLGAVVRTDIIQFAILTIGGTVVLLVAVHHLGGWGQLYEKTPELMHLHLPADHPKLPWTAMFGLFFLNINYWCANQSVMQRSLAARSLKDAQVGLMVGGVMKYYMAIMIVIPGIALAGITANSLAAEPDQAFTYIVTNYLPVGARGLILCALFASLMSTVDSLFNSLATLWSIDIYKVYIKPEAADKEVVAAGRRTILFTLCTGVLFGWLLMYYKFADSGAAFTHTLNEMRNYFNCGFVVLICAAAFLIAPKQKLSIIAFFSSTILHRLFIYFMPDMPYLFRAFWVILLALMVVAIPTIIQNGWRDSKDYIKFATPTLKAVGLALLASLVLSHIIFS